MANRQHTNCTCDPTGVCDACREAEKLGKAQAAVILAARVAVAGDDDNSDPNLSELRKTLRKLDRTTRA